MEEEKKSLTKKYFAEKLNHKFPEIEREDLEYIIENFFDVIKEELKKGNRVEIRDFGVFYLRKGKGLFFKNPKNMQNYYIKEKVRPVFKLGKNFKKRLNTPFLVALDLGTQTFRLCLGKIFNGKVYFLLKQRENVRLGEGLINHGKIGEEAFARGIEALKKLKKRMDEFEVEKYRAIGTAVFRKAKNAEEFLKKAQEECGIKIEIISPEEEAKLSLNGIIYGLKELGLNIEDFITIDVGGGSSEFIRVKNKKVEWSKSIEIGAVTLKEMFNLKYPLSTRIVKSMRDYIREKLKILPEEKVETLVITGGTASILGSLDLKLVRYIPERLHGHKVEKERIEKLINKLYGYSLIQLKKVKGMEEGREDIVIPGFLIYSEILNHFKNSYFIISEYGILEATLLSLISDYNIQIQ
jgi:exopolyphosphatase/guanosine-5'-triphosphate,3'-diphosphate pyrophosphatase